MNLKMAVWNCNGSLKLDVGAFKDSFKGRDIIFYSETHQAPGGILPKVSGYYWKTACRREVRSEYTKEEGREEWRSYSKKSYDHS